MTGRFRTENGFFGASALTWGCALLSTRHAHFCFHAFGSCVSHLTVLPSPTTQSLTASELSYAIWSTLMLPALNVFKDSPESLPH